MLTQITFYFRLKNTNCLTLNIKGIFFVYLRKSSKVPWVTAAAYLRTPPTGFLSSNILLNQNKTFPLTVLHFSTAEGNNFLKKSISK